MPTRKALTRAYLVALVSSAPLAALILVIFRGFSSSSYVIAIMFLAPVLIGVVALLWLVLLMKFLPNLWEFSAPVSGAIVGVLSFISYAVGGAITSLLLGQEDPHEILFFIGGYGFLALGWIPILFGAFAGWLVKKTDEKET